LISVSLWVLLCVGLECLLLLVVFDEMDFIYHRSKFMFLELVIIVLYFESMIILRLDWLLLLDWWVFLFFIRKYDHILFNNHTWIVFFVYLVVEQWNDLFYFLIILPFGSPLYLFLYHILITITITTITVTTITTIIDGFNSLIRIINRYDYSDMLFFSKMNVECLDIF